MSKILTFYIAFIFVAFNFPGPLRADIPSFPGAEGFGSTTLGGRGGTIIKVTNLDDAGPGSFRDACRTSGPRIVIFEIGGTIELNGAINIDNPYITIAGQTAPGGGVCLKGGELVVKTHDVIIRGLRIRLGDNAGNGDGLRLSGGDGEISNIIIDHCSISWAVDENVSTFLFVSNVTFSWNIISEALNFTGQSFGVLLGKDDTSNITVHHNLFVHNRARSVKIGRDVSTEVINNYVYNYGSKGTTVGPGVLTNIIGNYFKPGSNTLGWPDSPVRGIDIQLFSPSGETGDDPIIHVFDNIGPGRDDEGDEQWDVVNGDAKYYSPELTLTPSGVTVQPVMEVKDLLLEYAGAVPRDEVDERVVQDVLNNTGSIIETQDEVGGWPTLDSGTVSQDSDNDGMPDEWETEHELDPNNPNDASEDRNDDGYTNIEEYINSFFNEQLASNLNRTNSDVPERFVLYQNFPNPFNPSTIIKYDLPKSSIISLAIYNLLGQEVRSLVNKHQNAGSYAVDWNGKDNYGNIVPSGVYIYQLRNDRFVEYNKMVLLK